MASVTVHAGRSHASLCRDCDTPFIIVRKCGCRYPLVQGGGWRFWVWTEMPRGAKPWAGARYEWEGYVWPS